VCASSGKDDERKLLLAGRVFHPLFIENMIGLVCKNVKNGRYCEVFVGPILRKDARKSPAEFFLLVNKHCAVGNESGRDNDEAGRIVTAAGTQPMKKARSCDLAF
jgi:hypothetical protein